MNQLSLRSLYLPFLALAIFVVLTWPVWRWLWGEWMGNQYYSHGVLIPIVTLFLAIQRARNDPSFTWSAGQGKWSATWGLLLLALTIGLFLYFLNNKAYYLAAMSMIGIVAGMVWSLGGRVAARKLAFPLLYLALMVPLPFVERSTLPLALFTGVCSGGLVQWLGLDIIIVGNAVTLPNANLVIGAQCSGINSIIALVALTALAAYIFEGPLWGRVGLLLLSIPLAVLGNIGRVSSLLVVARSLGDDAAFTFYHDYSGPVFFVAILFLIYPLTRLLQCNTLRMDVI